MNGGQSYITEYRYRHPTLKDVGKYPKQPQQLLVRRGATVADRGGGQQLLVWRVGQQLLVWGGGFNSSWSAEEGQQLLLWGGGSTVAGLGRRVNSYWSRVEGQQLLIWGGGSTVAGLEGSTVAGLEGSTVAGLGVQQLLVGGGGLVKSP